MKLKINYCMAVAAICTTVFTSCKKDVTPTPTTSSTPLYALITGDTSLSVFNAAVQKACDSQLFLGTEPGFVRYYQ